MKTQFLTIGLTALVLLSAMLFAPGCASLFNSTDDATKVQNFLTNTLPPGFVGDVAVAHVNPYFDFGISATNVHQNAAGKWTWDSLDYHRADMLHTSGTIKLTPRPAPPPAAAVSAPVVINPPAASP